MSKNLTILCALMACIGFQSLAGAFSKDDDQPVKKRAGVEAGKRIGAEGDKRDSAQMASSMMKRFDKDNDEKLNMDELKAMIKFMQERRGHQGNDAAKAGAAGAKGGANKKNRRRPGAAENSAKKSEAAKEVGGVSPARPPAD